MVLFNGGGGWSDRALEQLQPGLSEASSQHEQDLAIFPAPRKTFAADLGPERTQLPDSCLLPASTAPPLGEPLTSH